MDSRCIAMGNGNPGESSKVEKEEGELSPNHDSDDLNFSTYQDNNDNGTHKGELEADGDDDDNEDVSGGGDDISGDESGGSREEEEEDDEEEEECKPESEGEGNGIEDSVDLLPPSEHFLRTVKPLAKCVASSSSSCGGEKKDSRVFYGNDAFYTLFRLHQVRIPFYFYYYFFICFDFD